MSNNIDISDGTDGIRLTFWSRWKIASGDSCGVYWWTDGIPQLVTTFGAGQNPDYPGWTKYYYELPANFSGFPQSNNVEFYFTSNSSGNDWGVGIDNVAVYQRQLNAPTNCQASDGNIGGITVTWDDNNAGTLVPEFYDIYRSDIPGGTHSYLATVSYGTNTYFDPTPSLFNYYYVVRARLTGWPDSAESNEDGGFGF
jgi:hypothetical protein